MIFLVLSDYLKDKKRKEKGKKKETPGNGVMNGSRDRAGCMCMCRLSSEVGRNVSDDPHDPDHGTHSSDCRNKRSVGGD